MYFLPNSISSGRRSDRYVPVVRSCEPRAHQNDDGEWHSMDAYGSTCGPFDSEVAAIAALCATLTHEGWMIDRDAALREAQAIADRRNGPICTRLRQLRTKHKERLHGLLIGKGQEARQKVRGWIMGMVVVPDAIVAAMQNL